MPVSAVIQDNPSAGRVEDIEPVDPAVPAVFKLGGVKRGVGDFAAAKQNIRAVFDGDRDFAEVLEVDILDRDARDPGQ